MIFDSPSLMTGHPRWGALILVFAGVSVLGSIFPGGHSDSWASEARMKFILSEPASSSPTTTTQQAPDYYEKHNKLAQAQPAQDEAPDLSTLYKKAKGLFRAGKYQTAGRLFQQVVDVDPNYKNAKKYLGEVNKQLAYQSGQESSRESARQLKATINAKLKEGSHELRKRHYNKALLAYQEVLKLDPTNKKAQSGIKKVRSRKKKMASQKAAEAKARQVREAAQREKEAAEQETPKQTFQGQKDSNRAEARAHRAAEKRKQKEQKAAQRASERSRKSAEKEERKQQSQEAKVRQEAEENARKERTAAKQAERAALKAAETTKQKELKARKAAQKTAAAKSKEEREEAVRAENESRRSAEKARKEQAEAEVRARRAAEKADREEQQARQEAKKAAVSKAQKEKEAAKRAERLALEAEKNVIKEKKLKIRGLLKEGKSRLRNDNYDDALEIFSTILEMDPAHKDAQKLVEKTNSEKQKAIKEARKAEMRARVDAAEALFEAGDFDRAMEAAHDILDKNPDNSDAQTILAKAQTSKEKQELEAREAALAAIREDLAQYVQRAEIYFEADQLDQAESESRKILEKDPENKDAMTIIEKVADRRAKIVAEQERLAEMARKEEEKLKFEKADKDFELGKKLYLEGDILTAVDTWNSVLNGVPDHSKSLAYLAQTSEEYAKAQEEKLKQDEEARKKEEIEQLLNTSVPLLDLMDTEIDKVLSLLGTISGFNIIASEGVGGLITVNIRQRTVREALDLILNENGFKYILKGKNIIVTPDFRTKFFPLSEELYDKIDQILEDPTSLKDPSKELRRLVYGASGVSTVPGKELRLNPTTRSLIVTDTGQNIEKVRAFLADMPEFIAAREPLISRHYKLNPDSAEKVFNLVELTLYGELGKRALSKDDPRLLALEKSTNIMFVKDTVEKIGEIEAILTNQSLLDRLTKEELVAREFQVALEPEPPAGASRTEWLYRQEQTVNFVIDILQQMLYGFEGQDEAVAKGRRIFQRSDYNLENDGTIVVVDTPQNIKKVDEFLSQSQSRGATIIEVIPVKHADINALKNLLDRVTGRVRETTTSGGGTVDQDDRRDRIRVTLTADPNSQTIIARASGGQRDALDAIKEVALRLDVPIPQIEIESRLVELRIDDTYGLTFDYQFFELFENGNFGGDDNRSTNLNLSSGDVGGLAIRLAHIG